MPNTAVFGQYWAASSPVHAMDPRTKLIASLAFMVLVFCSANYAGLAACALFVIAAFAAASIPPRQALKSISVLLFIVVITALLNTFFVQGGTVYVNWGWLQISQKGIDSALFLSARLFLLLFGASLLTLTTTMLDLTDAFEVLLGPLRKIGFPDHEFAMIMGIALRFLPQFVEESRTIRSAQLARGASFSKNPFHGGLQSLTSLMVPLFTSAFRHAETLSSGMDARCYHGSVGRTRLNPLKFARVDSYAVIACCVLLCAIVAANLLF